MQTFNQTSTPLIIRMTDYLAKLVWDKSNSSLSRKDWIKNIWNEFEYLYPIRITKSSLPKTFDDFNTTKPYRNGSNDFIDYLQGLPPLLDFPYTYEEILKCYTDVGRDITKEDENNKRDFDFWYWHCLVYALIKIGEEEKIEGRFLGKWKE